jgi:hypothetical protein
MEKVQAKRSLLSTVARAFRSPFHLTETVAAIKAPAEPPRIANRDSPSRLERAIFSHLREHQ